MSTDEPWLKIEALQSAVRYGGSSLRSIPQLIVSVCEHGDGEKPPWREFTPPGMENEDPVTHETFEAFVTANPPDGLGATVEMIKRVVAEDERAMVALRGALKGRPNPHGQNQHTPPTDGGSGSNGTGTTRGNVAAYTLDRLARAAPGLYDAVERGELSANSAAIKAGFRPRSFTIRAEPESAARSIRKQLPPDQITELVELLQQ